MSKMNEMYGEYVTRMWMEEETGDAWPSESNT